MQIGNSNNVLATEAKISIKKPVNLNVEKSETNSIKKDFIQTGSVKTGIVPTLKGAGVGMLTATVIGAGLTLATMGKGSFGAPLIGVTIASALTGAISGGAMANVTSSKTTGALIPAAISGGAGLLSVLTKGNSIGLVLAGTLALGAAGAAGASVAEKK